MKKCFFPVGLTAPGITLLPVSSARAAAEISPADTTWLMVASVFTTLMLIPGMALFYGGMLRRKNVLAVAMQAVGCCAIISLIWIVCGYSLVFTTGNAIIGGASRFMLSGMTPQSVSAGAPSVPETIFVMFELTFATITPMIILGGPADRMRFSGTMIFVGLWTLTVYCPIAHMVWGPGGMLSSEGDLDFAGGTVIHVTSGVAALVAAIMVGPRRHAGSMDMAPHNILLTMVGGCLVWAAWFCFDGGSALTAGALAAMALLNTHIAACAGVLAWLLGEWKIHGRPSLLGAVSGAISGLVAITPACGFVTPGSALVIGLAGGIVCLWAVEWSKRRFRYDDALDVWSIHGIGGIAGAFLTGVFATRSVGRPDQSGLIDGNWRQVIIQGEAVVLVLVWTALVTAALLFAIRYFGLLRVTPEEEEIGLDLSLHGETIRD